MILMMLIVGIPGGALLKIVLLLLIFSDRHDDCHWD